MDVGFVVYEGLDGRSGGYRYDRQLVSYLRERGDRVEVIAVPRRGYGRLVDGFSRSLRTRLDRPFDVLVQDELCHRSLWRHNPRLTRPNAVVALVHLVASADPTTRRVSRAVTRQLERRYLRSVDGAVCTSRHTEAAALALAGRTLPSTVAYPGGRATVSGRNRARERTQDEPLRVLFVGNVVPRKRVLTLLDALAGVPGCEAAIVGGLDANPAYARRVVRRVGELPDGSVSVHGAVPDEELVGLYEWADVLAVPSAYEGFGMVYLEAMERGVVPVASSRGGASEVVEHGTSGLVVSPESRAVRDALSRLAADRELLDGLASGALEAAADHPDWEESMARVRAFLAGAGEGGDHTNSQASADAPHGNATDEERDG